MSDKTLSCRALPGSPDPTRRTAAVRIPFPARLNLHAERARQHTLQWVQGMGLISGDVATAEYDALRLERLMAYFYPDAGASDLELAADFNAWFFIFDDQFDGLLGTRPEEIRRVVDALVGTMAVDGAPHPDGTGDTPLVRSFRDIWLRSIAGTPVAWRLRFRAHWSAYLAAHEGEAHHRNSDRLPSLERFLDVRRETIGVRPCLDFTERCGGYSLPDSLHDLAALREMREITGDVVIFVNDIVSLAKELAAGDVNNSVVVHRGHKGCTLQESVDHVSALANTRTARFARLAGALTGGLAGHGVPPELRDHVEHYVDGMRHLMAGNLTWSLATARYDETGAAAAGGGHRPPWSALTAAGDTAPSPHRGEV
ncbi:isoafricanol synthase [Streptomyces sp. NPDC049040]|uniref:isoafricanol synthase n=1 Tax=Streptomyces sp. NPDC049040 TaxID=3365593 RepID=UPI003713949F